MNPQTPEHPTPSAPAICIEQAHADLRLNTEALRAFVAQVLAAEGYRAAYLGLILTDHETVRQLNQDYLGRDYLTDVLAFSLGDAELTEEKIIDGEVYIDLDTAAERAPEFGVSFELEARRYVVHGMLHLMGYDDRTPEDKATMQRLEDRYLVFS